MLSFEAIWASVMTGLQDIISGGILQCLTDLFNGLLQQG